MNWIKISEKLPKKGLEYLVWVRYPKENCHYPAIRRFFSKELWLLESVTHWCEIEEPKE